MDPSSFLDKIKTLSSMISQKVEIPQSLSFRRKPESSYFNPALGGMDPGFHRGDDLRDFCETIIFDRIITLNGGDIFVKMNSNSVFSP
jgi:hypothetical protein